ncbi:hypothetical protein Pmar_PMAR002523 [Perkinsus marinus ATCC 50983]|uniref:Uncharacterized protein n=1 Tax=Perkinsus marinus (strain ATCC 50983 / TXsc) TaxID=423536 RepID=C5LV11_PERM5|nr:hypothetical protein Pmar_PMAR002523 [Perkinsus marinus ATCC 50983]EEQ99426.1 hypothetical protein Pmar_PMAR002523 [Perkinsus marinus ATCC 50983]|eukprot:XP_002766709.1 hypothetical protein Pmar_PMAR002523 [Perkinsus marinus ATCC 50983]
MPPEGGVFEVYQEMLSEVAGKRVSKFGREANNYEHVLHVLEARTLRFCLLIGCAVVLVGEMRSLHRRLALCLFATLFVASALPYSAGNSRRPSAVMGVGYPNAEAQIDQLVSSLGSLKASTRGDRKSPSVDEVLKAIEMGTSVGR